MDVDMPQSAPTSQGGTERMRAAVHNLPQFSSDLNPNEAYANLYAQSAPTSQGGTERMRAAVHNLPQFSSDLNPNEAYAQSLKYEASNADTWTARARLIGETRASRDDHPWNSTSRAYRATEAKHENSHNRSGRLANRRKNKQAKLEARALKKIERETQEAAKVKYKKTIDPKYIMPKYHRTSYYTILDLQEDGKYVTQSHIETGYQHKHRNFARADQRTPTTKAAKKKQKAEDMIREAYRVLGDPELRTEYDMHRIEKGRKKRNRRPRSTKAIRDARETLKAEKSEVTDTMDADMDDGPDIDDEIATHMASAFFHSLTFRPKPE